MKLSQLISPIRWVLVPLVAIAAYWLAASIAFGFYLLGGSLCPANQIESGTCIAPWYDPFVHGLMFITPSLAATLIIFGCTLTAPNHRRLVAILTLAAGSGYALSMGRAFAIGGSEIAIFGMSFAMFGMSSAIFAIVVGGLITAWLTRRDWTQDRIRGEETTSPQKSKGMLAVVFTVVLLLSLGLSKWRAGLSGSKFREVTPTDVPRLIQALESRENPIKAAEAAYALGRIGRPAVPAVPILIQALQDKDRMVASGALFALERIGPAANAAVPDLKRLAVGDGKYTDARGAIRALGGIGDVEAILEAASVAKYGYEDGVADAVREYDLEGKGLEALLVKLFREGSSDYVKESAAIGLARIAPQTKGLVDYLQVKLEDYVGRDTASPTESGRLYWSKQIQLIRTALKQIGTEEAQSVLQRHASPHTGERSN